MPTNRVRKLQEGLDTPVKDIIQQMRDEGMSIKDIADSFGVYYTTMLRAMEDLNIRKKHCHYDWVGALGMPLDEFRKLHNIDTPYATITNRIHKHNMSLYDAVTRKGPMKRKPTFSELGMSIEEYARINNGKDQPRATTIRLRLARGWDLQRAINTPNQTKYISKKLREKHDNNKLLHEQRSTIDRQESQQQTPKVDYSSRSRIKIDPPKRSMEFKTEKEDVYV